MSSSAVQLLAFDVDHTLVRYNMETFLPLMHRLTRDALSHEDQAWAAAMLDAPFSRDLCVKGTIFDKAEALFVMPDAQGRVIRAATATNDGFSWICDDQLTRLYGQGTGRVSIQLEETSRWHAFYTAFETPLVGLLVRVLMYADTHKLQRTLVSAQFFHAIQRIYKEFFSVYDLSTSPYFRELATNTSLYVLDRKNTIRPWLDSIRIGGDKQLAIISNSPDAYVDLVCQTALGNNWRTLFDHVVCSAQKPAYFDRGVAGTPTFEDIEPTATVLYYGDHLWGDIWAAKNADAGWATAAIVELSTHDFAAPFWQDFLQTHADVVLADVL